MAAKDIGGGRVKQETAICRWREIVSGWKNKCLSALRRLGDSLYGEEIVVTGESWYGDSQDAEQRCVRLRPEEDGVLIYRTPSGLEQHIFLTKDEMTVGGSFQADRTLNAPGMADVGAVFSRKFDNGTYRYFVKKAKNGVTVEVDGESLPDLRENDSSDNNPGHELQPGDIIVLSGFAVRFLRRAVSSGAKFSSVEEPSYSPKNVTASMGIVNSGGN